MERRGETKRERDRCYQDNLLTAVRCNLCLNKHRGTLCMTPETPSPPRRLVDATHTHTHIHSAIHRVMRKAGGVCVYQYTAVVRKLLSLYLTLSPSQCKPIDLSQASQFPSHLSPHPSSFVI